MDKQAIINRLNWFYSLELTQVDNYIAQAKLVKDPYTAKALERFAFIEQQHVDNIAAHIIELGSEPTRPGDVISPWLGKLIGNITPATGIAMMLKTNIAIEQKAKRDYKSFIDQVNDQELLKTLWSNFIDEDLHTSWMISKVQQLASQKEKETLKI